MKRFLQFALLMTLVVATTGCAREHTVVILSTNDIHAKIQYMPQLASAVATARDTAEVILVDAGDRWTGSAVVDKATMPGLPVITLMNDLGYDVGTLGNHEFDFGQAALGRMLDSMRFEVVCANVVSDTSSFPRVKPYTIVERGGVRFGFVGVVTNYEGRQTPAGRAENFRGLRFPDPQAMARAYADSLRGRCDVRVLISHMGDDRDAQFLAAGAAYDLVIGGHSHKQIDTLINGVMLTQTGKDLKNLGVTVVRMKGRKVLSMEYRLVSLADYAADVAMQNKVERYYTDPEMQRTVGALSQTASKVGLANLIAGLILQQTQSQVAFYHYGGVRLDSLSGGDVRRATVYDLEPFAARVSTLTMTPEAMRRMILSKFNDPINTKESHRVDLFSTTPYTIFTDAAGDAVDVRFPQLVAGRSYRVALSDYIYNNYKDLDYTDGVESPLEITDLLFDALAKSSPLRPDNLPRQHIVKK